MKRLWWLGCLLAILLIATYSDAQPQKGPPASMTADKPKAQALSPTRLKELKAKNALTRAKKARDQALAAKEAYEKALQEADQADQDAALAEIDFLAAVAKDATAHADTARAEAERAVAEAKRADDARKEAERAAGEATRRAKAPVSPPAVRSDKGDHPLPAEDLAKYVRKRPEAKPELKKDRVEKPVIDKSPKPATITLIVPAYARVSIDGRMTTLTGSERTFQTPPLPVGRNFTYVFVVSLDNDRDNDVRREVVIRAGETITEDFTK